MTLCSSDRLTVRRMKLSDLDELYSLIERQKNIPALLAELHAMKLEADLYGVLTEILAGMQ